MSVRCVRSVIKMNEKEISKIPESWEIESKALKWSSKPDAKIWDVYVPHPEFEDIVRETSSDMEGSNLVFIIGRAGIGKDHVRIYLINNVQGYVNYNKVNFEDESKKLANDVLFKRCKEDGRYKEYKDNVFNLTLFRIIYGKREVEKTIRNQLIYFFNGRSMIFKMPDNVTEFGRFRKQMEELTDLYYELEEQAEKYYIEHGEIPNYKMIVFMLEEHTGSKLERIQELQIFRKAKKIFIKPLSIKMLLNIYRENINVDCLPFTEKALIKLAERSHGIPRKFKDLIYENIKVFGDSTSDTIKEKDLIKYDDSEFQETMQLYDLYVGLERANARQAQYYPRIKRIIEENPHVEFKTQKQILEYALREYPQLKLNNRKISECLSPINKVNDLRNEFINYERLIYLDLNGIYRVGYEQDG